MMLRAAALLLLVGVQPMAAHARPQEAIASTAQNADPALAVTDFAVPPEQTIATMTRAFDQMMAGARSREDVVAFEKRYPGADAVVRADLRAMLVGLGRDKMVPQLRARVMAFMRGRFDDAELRELADFFESPTGRKLGAAARAGIESGTLATMRDANGQVNVTQAMEAGNRQGKQAALDAMAAADMPVLEKFGASPVAQKMQAAKPALQQLVSAFTTDFLRENLPAIQQSFQKSVQRQIALRNAASKGKSKQ